MLLLPIKRVGKGGFLNDPMTFRFLFIIKTFATTRFFFWFEGLGLLFVYIVNVSTSDITWKKPVFVRN
jgi:hypothetical protein